MGLQGEGDGDGITRRRFQPGLKNPQEVHVINRKGILARAENGT